jgi:hypothetical protein
MAYNSIYKPLNTAASAVTASTQIVIDGERGGWGSLTMGILKQVDQMGKSFGVYGYALSTSSYDA